MDEVFVKVLNMSIAASWLILAVMLLRLTLKRAPRWAIVLLWGIAALRLAVPFSFESAWSLVPSAETFSTYNIQFETPAVSSGIPVVNNAVNPILGEVFAPGPGASVNPLYVWMSAASVVWLLGVAAMLLYAVISYVRVRRSVAERIPCARNIFLCDHVKSPFILGLAAPGIYLPSHLDASALGPVIAHEKAHLARRDHWWKPLGFLILTVHWFNPLCWAAYVLLCRDIEQACDEKVIRQLDLNGKKRYSAALLACSTGRRPVLVAVCPLAFGETGVKERVRNVLHYKKPAFWVVSAAVIACAATAVCFLTDPVKTAPGTAVPGAAAPGAAAPNPDGGGEPAVREPAPEEPDFSTRSEEQTAIRRAIGTLIEAICGSPTLSSNPEDSIIEHAAAYRELTYYGRYTLKYCFARFEEGGETGLDGQIMMRACRDIAAGWGEEPLMVFNLPADGVLTGQMWYDAFKNNALELMEQSAEMELAERYPASYLLLSMLGEF